MQQNVMQVVRKRLQGEASEQGVTLIELLAVIVILAVIAAIAVPVVLGSISKSKVSVTQQNMAVIIEALNRYATNNNGKYPTSNSTSTAVDIDLLGAASTNPLTTADPNNNEQPYLKVIPNDGWGNHFVYSSDGTGFVLRTNDGQAGVDKQTTNSDTWWENESMASANNSTPPSSITH